MANRKRPRMVFVVYFGSDSLIDSVILNSVIEEWTAILLKKFFFELILRQDFTLLVLYWVFCE